MTSVQCASRGIQRFHTMTGESHSNGVAERANRIIKERITAMLDEAHLPHSFWEYALNALVHVRNRCPTSALNGGIPFTAMFGKIPNVSHFRVFGCTAYVHVKKNKRTSLSPHAQKCVFIGYPGQYKGWKFYDPLTRKTILSDRAEFDERYFPGLSRTPPSIHPPAPPPSSTPDVFPGSSYDSDDDDDSPPSRPHSEMPKQVGDTSISGVQSPPAVVPAVVPSSLSKFGEHPPTSIPVPPIPPVPPPPPIASGSGSASSPAAPVVPTPPPSAPPATGTRQRQRWENIADPPRKSTRVKKGVDKSYPGQPYNKSVRPARYHSQATTPTPTPPPEQPTPTPEPSPAPPTPSAPSPIPQHIPDPPVVEDTEDSGDELDLIGDGDGDELEEVHVAEDQEFFNCVSVSWMVPSFLFTSPPTTTPLM